MNAVVARTQAWVAGLAGPQGQVRVGWSRALGRVVRRPGAAALVVLAGVVAPLLAVQTTTPRLQQLCAFPLLAVPVAVLTARHAAVAVNAALSLGLLALSPPAAWWAGAAVGTCALVGLLAVDALSCADVLGGGRVVLPWRGIVPGGLAALVLAFVAFGGPSGWGWALAGVLASLAAVVVALRLRL